MIVDKILFITNNDKVILIFLYFFELKIVIIDDRENKLFLKFVATIIIS